MSRPDPMIAAVVDRPRKDAPGMPPLLDMVWVPGGTFRMGSDKHYPEERPVRRVTVDGFSMDRFPVTNERFERFVTETGHRTFAEIPPNPKDYPGALPDMLSAGSLVFVKPAGAVDTRDISNWWHYTRDAYWRQPQGPGSSIDGLGHHPGVHVTFGDAEAFAAWEVKVLPTEAEWEFAACGGLDGADYAWGDEFLLNDRHMANTLQGEFPCQSPPRDGYEGTSPLGAYPPKRKVVKGGSHLCAPNYCRRYRPAARFPEPVDRSTCHVGFRCVVRSRKVG